MSRDGTAPVQDCPGRDELAAFNYGRVPLDKLESIAEHLSTCEGCERSLQALLSEDPILPHLRRDPPAVSVDQTVCAQLADLARAIALEQTALSTMPELPVAGVRGGPPLPAVFGTYLLLEQLGEGGMGVVYKAQQQALKRPVALKMVRTGAYASAEERIRFQREGEAIARIRHPHVVQIYEFGEHDGQPFFSMELLEGGTLADKLKGLPLPPREAAELVRTLAQAVQAAHQQGIVHRDLKPANVLLAADGTVKISDFGLAKVLDAENSDTRSDTILGTPAYMAPEQARGEARTIGPLADVYALGAILYECLTGRPPFRAQTRIQTLELVRQREPEAPSRLRPGLARDLEAICLKCLEKEAGRRYPSAAELADDLDHWLHGQPTRVRPLSLLGRGGRSLRRHPRTVAACALFLLLSVAIAAVWWHRDPDRPIQRIETELVQGRPQTLIGEKGLPVWYRWSVGGAQIGRAPDVGACSLQSWTLSLLELVRDPQLDRYRFQAEVRHEKSNDPGRVGIYFGYRNYQAGPDLMHSFGHLSFDDVNDIRAVRNRIPPALLANQPPPPEGNPVYLGPRLYSINAQGVEWELGIPGLDPRLFKPAGSGSGPFHKLRVEVTPESVRGFWNDKEVGELKAEDWIRNCQQAAKRRMKMFPDDPRPRNVQPQWQSRGSLGLYLSWGSASFRNVVVEPLPPSN